MVVYDEYGPVRDGLRTSVDGRGQTQPIDTEHPAEDCGTQEGFAATPWTT